MTRLIYAPYLVYCKLIKSSLKGDQETFPRDLMFFTPPTNLTAQKEKHIVHMTLLKGNSQLSWAFDDK